MGLDSPVGNVGVGVCPAIGVSTAVLTVPGVDSKGYASRLKVRGINVCNRGPLTTFRLSVDVAGTGEAAGQYLAYDMPLSNVPVAWEFDDDELTLTGGAVVRGQSANGMVDFVVFGSYA